MDWRYLFLQRFHGSITVIPRASLTHLINLAADPDLDMMKSYMARGSVRFLSILLHNTIQSNPIQRNNNRAQCVYPALTRIHMRVDIEKALEEALQSVASRLAAAHSLAAAVAQAQVCLL